MEPVFPRPTLTSPPLPQPRQNKAVLVAVGCVVVLLGGGAVLWKSRAHPPLLRGEVVERPLPEATATGEPVTPPESVKLRTSYAQLPVAGPPTASQPSSSPQALPAATAPATAAGRRTVGGGTSTSTSPSTFTPTRLEKPGRLPAPAREPGRQAPSTPTGPSDWLFADLKGDKGIQAPPFAVPKEDGEASGKPSALFPKAVWERPADPTKVLYASQVINGLLLNAVNSQQPGVIRILVTEDIEDKFFQRRVLLPQYTVLLATQAGSPKFGQNVLLVTVSTAELPDGTNLVLANAKVGDTLGATGLPGDVDNRWRNVILGAGISALLSIGSQNAGGQSSGFQPSLPQGFARDVSGSLNTSGQAVVKRELDTTPILTAPHGAPVTVQLGEAVSLQTPPLVIKK